MTPQFIKERRQEQLARLRTFITKWLELGELISSKSDKAGMNILRREMASLSPISIYTLPAEACIPRETSNFLSRLTEIDTFSPLAFNELIREWHDILLGLYWAEGWLNKEEMKNKTVLIEEIIDDWLKLSELTGGGDKNEDINLLKRKLVNEFSGLKCNSGYRLDYKNTPLAVRDLEEAGRKKDLNMQWQETHFKLVELLGIARAQEETKKKASPISIIAELIDMSYNFGEKINRNEVTDIDIIHFKGYMWSKYKMIMQEVFQGSQPGRPDVLQTNVRETQISIQGIIELLQIGGESISKEISRRREKLRRRRKQKAFVIGKIIAILMFIGIPLKIFYATGHDIRDYIGGKPAIVKVKTFADILAETGKVDDAKFISLWDEKWHLTGNIPAFSGWGTEEYIYCGDFDGKVRVYDRLLREWDNPIKLLNESIYCMGGVDKKIFLGTGSGIYEGDIHKGHITNVREISKAIKNITCFHITDNTLWIGSSNGLGQMTIGKGKIKIIRVGLPDERVTALGSDGNYLWIGTAKGISFLSLKTLARKIRKLNVEEYITSIICSEKEVWAGGAGSIYQYSKNDRIWQKISLGNSPGFWVRDIALSGNILWITTQGEGVIKYNIRESIWKNYFIEELSSSAIFPVNRSLWFHKGSFGSGKVVECILPEEAFKTDEISENEG